MCVIGLVAEYELPTTDYASEVVFGFAMSNKDLTSGAFVQRNKLVTRVRFPDGALMLKKLKIKTISVKNRVLKSTFHPRKLFK